MTATKQIKQYKSKASTKATRCAVKKPTVLKRKTVHKKYNNDILQLLCTPQSADIAYQNSNSSPLLRLPPEIRQKIYTHVLGNKHYKVHVPRSKLICKIETGERGTNLSFLLVCRQIYEEVALLPFTQNSFETWPHLAERWLGSIMPGQANAIATMRVNFPEAKLGPGFLGYFPGLRKVEVLFTPTSWLNDDGVVRTLRSAARKSDLKVAFREFD